MTQEQKYLHDLIERLEKTLNVPEVSHKEASLALNDGDLGLALVIYKQLLDIDPDDADARTGFTKAYTSILETNEAPDETDSEIRQTEHLRSLLHTIKMLEAMRDVIKRRSEKTARAKEDV
ncbi:hypothetical protein JW979_10915 [bacterium]|nr:hypothetical protein [candidate division CSSED10-310 bacterium]